MKKTQDLPADSRTGAPSMGGMSHWIPVDTTWVRGELHPLSSAQIPDPQVHKQQNSYFYPQSSGVLCHITIDSHPTEQGNEYKYTSII